MSFFAQMLLAFLMADTPACKPEPPNPPAIEKIARASRNDGLWHDVFLHYEGKANQKFTLRVFWDAKTPAEDGSGSISSKSAVVHSDDRGHGQWKLQVKGYPAGKVRANLTDEQGRTSPMCAPYEMPWIY